MGNKAIIAQVTEVHEIPGADRIHLARVLGESVVVSKDVGVGFIGVLFPVGVALSKEYAKKNNLFRHASMNEDQTKTGFFEESCRVRAQPFLKVKSEGYFATLESLVYTGVDLKLLKLGETFDVLNGQQICTKYISKETRERIAKQGVAKPKKKVETPFFDKHVDSEQFRHFAERIPTGALLSFHAKVHGTSARVSHTLVEKPITGFWNKMKAHLSGNRELVDRKWDIVVGTRNVVLDNPEKEGFHGKEAYRFEVAEMLRPYLEKGMTVYGEIAGYANGSPIMPAHNVKALKDKAFTKKYGDNCVYKYSCAEHEYRFHVYRITRLTQNGVNVDMSQKEMEQWCKDRGILTTLEVHPQIVYDGDIQKLKDLVEQLTERPDVLTEDYIDPSHISEGIIIRVDSNKHRPDFYKHKSYAFRVLEGLCEAVDTEDAS